jgi:hypothetical protein
MLLQHKSAVIYFRTEGCTAAEVQWEHHVAHCFPRRRGPRPSSGRREVLNRQAAQHRRGVVEHLGRWRLGLAPVHGVVADAAHGLEQLELGAKSGRLSLGSPDARFGRRAAVCLGAGRVPVPARSAGSYVDAGRYGRSNRPRF